MVQEFYMIKMLCFLDKLNQDWTGVGEIDFFVRGDPIRVPAVPLCSVNNWLICRLLNTILEPFLLMSVCFDWLQAEEKRGRSLYPQRPEILSHGQGELWQYRVKRAGKDNAWKGRHEAHGTGQGIMGRNNSRINLLVLKASENHSPRLQSAVNLWKIIQITSESVIQKPNFYRILFFQVHPTGIIHVIMLLCRLRPSSKEINSQALAIPEAVYMEEYMMCVELIHTAE